MATACLLERIIEMTDVATDQEHLDVIVFNRPNVPDRTAYLLGQSPLSPAVSMRDTALKLEALGAAYLATPCVTAHALLHEITPGINIAFINMVDETASALSRSGMTKTGIMATNGTVATGLFQHALEKLDIEPVLPISEHQHIVMELIYDYVKAGRRADMEKFYRVTDRLFDSGCDSIILGCTELSVIDYQETLSAGFIDSLDVLAARSVELCEKPLKPCYSSLIQKLS